MKIYILLLFLCLLIVSSCDKDEISNSQMETFVKYYGGNLHDEGYRVISLNNGGYLLMGTMETPDRGKDICVIRTDKYGNSVAPVQLYDGKGFDDFGYAIKKDSAGYVIGGSTATVSSNDKKDIFLLQIDENGVEHGRSTIGTSLNEEAFDLLVASNDDIVITGYTDSTKSLSKDLILVRTNSKLNLISFNHLILQGDNAGYSITESGKEGEYVIAGYITYWKNINENEIFVVKWSGLGIASPYYLNNYFDKSADAKAISILPAGNENYLLSCNFNATGDSSLIKVIKFDLNGNFLNLVWNKNYGVKKINKVGCSRLSDNKIYILGTVGTNNKFDVGNMLMLVLDGDGNNPQYHNIGDGLSFTGWGFDFTKDGYIIAGANKQNEFSLVTLIKINKNFTL